MTDNIQEVEGESPDLRTELARKLEEIVPEAIADGKVDVTKLKELLAYDAGDESERFGLFWPGKRRALKAAQAPTTATLKPAMDESKDWATTKNVFIEGDNLEVLKVLQRHYHGKIKMIYIDPPYNTGKDFIYPDNFREGLQSYLEFTKQVDEGGKKLSSNTESDGRYHSNWLNMMYPRLKLARNLLTEDGVIFISIDDHEVAHLRRLCDEVFGEANFVTAIMRKRKKEVSSDSKNVAIQGEYVLVYSRSSHTELNSEPLRDSYIASSYKEPSSDFPDGMWRPVPITVSKGLKGGGYRYEIIAPSGSCHDRLWAYPHEGYERLVQEGRVYFGVKGDAVPQRVIYAHESEGQPTSNYWDETATNKQGKKAILDLFGENVFDTPKPRELVERMIRLVDEEDLLVLDFFSGSGTTAHAMMAMNAEDGGNRGHIQVQIPEPTDEESEAYKAGFTTIAELARERINRAGEMIIADKERALERSEVPLDIGYRTYKLVDTNFAKWRVPSDIERDELQEHLEGFKDRSNDDATAEDLLTEILLKQGYSLSEEVSEIEVAGLLVHSVGEGLLLAYLDESQQPTLDQLRAMVDLAPARIVVLEDAFQGDDELKANIAETCKSNQVELWTV